MGHCVKTTSGFSALRMQREAGVMGVVDDGASVDLIGEDGAGFQNAAGSLGFGRANGRAAIEWCGATIPFTTIEVEQRDVVPERGVARDGAGAAAFRIAGMSTGDHDLEFRGCLGEQRHRSGS